MNLLKQKPTIFVGGLHRSGTTLLYKYLGAHQDISIIRNTEYPKNEGQYLQNLFPIGHLGGPGRFGFRTESYRTEADVADSAEALSQLSSDWGKHFDTQCQYVAEKSPQNIVRSRFFQKIVPNSFFLFIIRHPVPVALATQKWSDTSLMSLFDHWVTVHEALREDIRHLQNVGIVFYEDLVSNPHKIIKCIFDWLSVDTERYSPADEKKLSKSHNDRYFSQWRHLKSRKLKGINIVNKINKVLRELNLKAPDIPLKMYGSAPIRVDPSAEIADIKSRYTNQINKFGFNINVEKGSRIGDTSIFDNWRVGGLKG